MYISSHYRPTPCYVESITERARELLQLIQIEDSDEVPSNMYFNMVAGDDGYLWLCGFNDNIMRIIKYTKPDLTLRNVTLTSKDIDDMWERNDYVWEEDVLPGMTCYGNRLYVTYGGFTGRREVFGYGTLRHISWNIM